MAEELYVRRRWVFFVNYLSAIYEPRLMPTERRVMYPNEEKLLAHRSQVERYLKDTRATPKIWSKYFWVANYHNSFCDQLGMKHCRIDESFLRQLPQHL